MSTSRTPRRLKDLQELRIILRDGLADEGTSPTARAALAAQLRATLIEIEELEKIAAPKKKTSAVAKARKARAKKK